MQDSSDHRAGISTPVINRIDHEALRFRTLVTQLRLNKKKSACDTPFNMHSQLEISGIEHRSDNYEKNSFDLELQNDLTVKKNGYTVAPICFRDRSEGKEADDKGLKYKPRSSVNGRDDIRIRNLN